MPNSGRTNGSARSSGWTTRLDSWSGLPPVPMFRPDRAGAATVGLLRRAQRIGMGTQPSSCKDRKYRGSMSRSRSPNSPEQIRRFGETTIAYYDRFAREFWYGTRHHDVSQNYAAFLEAIEGDPPCSILDLGCGPGRDLSYFRSLGHEAVGLDGSQQFVAMARAQSGCEVLYQDLLTMRLPEGR